MGMRTVDCSHLTVFCDVCLDPLADDNTGAVRHFDTEQYASETALREGWRRVGALWVCQRVGPRHQAAVPAAGSATSMAETREAVPRHDWPSAVREPHTPPVY
jgi:hypothetical protein